MVINIPAKRLNSDLNYRCQDCDFVTKHVPSLKRHNRIHHRPATLLNPLSLAELDGYRRGPDGYWRRPTTRRDGATNKGVAPASKKVHGSSWVFSDNYYRCQDCDFVTKHLPSLKRHNRIKHRPATVLNQDGTHNPLSLVDVDGYRRGPDGYWSGPTTSRDEASKKAAGSSSSTPSSNKRLPDIHETVPVLDVPNSSSNMVLPVSPKTVPPVRREVPRGTFEVPGKFTCEICGFKASTKNKCRELQDHLLNSHFKEKVDKDLHEVTPRNTKCPQCDYVAKDRQTVYRHYFGRHGTMERYLNEYRRSENMALVRRSLAQSEVRKTDVVAEKDGMSQNMTRQESSVLDHGPAASKILDKQVSSMLPVAGSSKLTFTPLYLWKKINTTTNYRTTTAESLSCEICNFKTKGKRKWRELQDHLISDHFKSRIEKALTFDPFKCPLCDYKAPQKQSVYRHYAGKHGAMEMYLNEYRKSLAAGEVQETDVATESHAMSDAMSNMDISCEICNFKPKSERKYRELQDHLISYHFKSKMDKAITFDPFKCPLCNYVAPKKYLVSMHYAEKHGLLEKYLDEYISMAAGKVQKTDVAIEKHAMSQNLTPEELSVSERSLAEEGHETDVLIIDEEGKEDTEMKGDLQSGEGNERVKVSKGPKAWKERLEKYLDEYRSPAGEGKEKDALIIDSEGKEGTEKGDLHSGEGNVRLKISKGPKGWKAQVAKEYLSGPKGWNAEMQREKSLMKKVELPTWPVPLTPDIMKLMREDKKQREEQIKQHKQQQMQQQQEPNISPVERRLSHDNGDDVNEDISEHQQQKLDSWLVANSDNALIGNTPPQNTPNNQCEALKNQEQELQQQEQQASSGQTSILSQDLLPPPTTTNATDEQSQDHEGDLGEIPPLVHVRDIWSQDKEGNPSEATTVFGVVRNMASQEKVVIVSNVTSGFVTMLATGTTPSTSVSSTGLPVNVSPETRCVTIPLRDDSGSGSRAGITPPLPETAVAPYDQMTGVLSEDAISPQLPLQQDMPPAPIPQQPLLPNTKWDSSQSQSDTEDQSEAPKQIRRMVTFHTVKDSPIIQSVQSLTEEAVEESPIIPGEEEEKDDNEPNYGLQIAASWSRGKEAECPKCSYKSRKWHNVVAHMRRVHMKKGYKHVTHGKKAHKKKGHKKNYKKLISKLKRPEQKQTKRQNDDGNLKGEPGETNDSTLKKSGKRKIDGGITQPNTTFFSEELYCECRDVWGEEDMVACDNKSCPIEWFHFRCVQVTSTPVGKWFCPNCRGDTESVMRSQIQLDDEQSVLPSDTSPSETCPYDTSPSDTSPFHTCPSETSPSDTSQSYTSPSYTSPSDPSQSDPSPPDTSPCQDLKEDRSEGPKVARRRSSDEDRIVMKFCNEVRKEDELRKLRRENERLKSEADKVSHVREENLKLREEVERLKSELKKKKGGKSHDKTDDQEVDPPSGGGPPQVVPGSSEEQPDYCWYSSFLEIPIAFPRDDHEL